jgi:hypothetical protein
VVVSSLPASFSRTIASRYSSIRSLILNLG